MCSKVRPRRNTQFNQNKATLIENPRKMEWNITPIFRWFQKSKTVRPSDAKNQRPSRFYLFKIHQKMGEIIIKLGFSTKFYSPSSIRCTEYCQVTRRWSRTRIFSVSSASSFAYRCSTTVKGCSLSSLSRISSYRQRLLTFDNLGAWRSEVRAHAFSCEQRIVSVLAFCPVWI